MRGGVLSPADSRLPRQVLSHSGTHVAIDSHHPVHREAASDARQLILVNTNGAVATLERPLARPRQADGFEAMATEKRT